MSIDFQNPTYWRCVNSRMWQHAAAIRGCTIDRVMQDHGGYDTPKPAPVAEPVVVVRPRLRPKNVVPVAPAQQHFSHEQKQAWKAVTRARYRRAGLTQEALAEAMGYSVQTIRCSFSKSSNVTSEFMRKVEDVLPGLEALNLPPIEDRIAITAEWARLVHKKRRELGMKWDDVARVAGYTRNAIQVACRAGWTLTPTKKAAIEALLRMAPAAEGGAA